MILKHTSLSLPGRLVRNRERPYVPGGAITIKSTVTDSGGPRATILRPGLVVVKKTSDGLYYPADDAAADRAAAPAAISTTSHADGNGVIKLVGNHGTISVTTTTGAGTEANNATDLNANAAFAAHYVAASGAGELTITARATGEKEWFYIHADTRDTAGFSEGEAYAVQGTDADYRVLEDYVDMLDETGTAADATAPNTKAGTYLTANLLKLTPEARATLAKRGSIFE